MNMERESASKLARTIIVLLIVGALAAFPLFGPPIYFISFGFMILMYVTLATSWNIIGGYAGYLSFGHVAFLGIGAYTTALITNHFGLHALGTVGTVLPAGLVAAGIAVVVGYPCLRLRGPYFAVITLCFAFVVHLAVKNLSFMGGSDGLWIHSMKVPIEWNRLIFYELMLILVVATTAASAYIGGSKFGAGLRAIKEDEEVAQTMAVNAPALKSLAFALSAFFVGVAGGLYGYYLEYFHPDTVFDVNISILIVLMALFGGGSSWLGPVLGATILSLVNEGLSTFVNAELARIIYGSLFIVVIIFMPNGIIEFFKKRPKSVEENAALT
jgi:branched-chain amino acid transport system permease protein